MRVQSGGGFTAFLMGLVLVWTQATGAAEPGFQPGKREVKKSARTEVFQPARVWQIVLTLSEKEYQAMQPPVRGGFPGFGGRPALVGPEKKDNREVHRNAFGVDLPWAVGSVTVDGQTFPNVGIRYKGNGTYGDASRSLKRSFKIDLDRRGETARFNELKTLNLHCGVADPSKCRETLSYGLYRDAGVPAPHTALAEVSLTVPGKFDRQYLGLYTLVEQIDKQFLRTTFGDGTGLLMKPEGVREFEYRGEDWARYEKLYKTKREATPAERRRVIDFCSLVHRSTDEGFRKEIGTYLDVDGFLRFMAATALVVNPDCFFSLGHNYYLYLHPTTNKFHLFPWDLDRGLANFAIFGSGEQQMNLSIHRPFGGTHKLVDRLMAMPGNSEKYQQILRELSQGCFSRERMLAKFTRHEAAVKELVARDAAAARERKENSAAAFLFGRPPELKVFAEKRSASVAAQLAGTSRGHVPGSGFGFPPLVAPAKPRPGDVLSGPVQTQLKLTTDQRRKVAELQRDVETRLQNILTREQQAEFQKLRESKQP